jgi:hypothetical protein
MEPRGISGLMLVATSALLSAAPGRADDLPEMNKLRGTVVYAEDGRPAARVPVMMASQSDGYIYFSEGGMRGYGAKETVLLFFTKRNSKHYCSTVTDEDGGFTLENFGAPDQAWNVAAGSGAGGYALLTELRPRDYADKPLRIEIGKPAYITTTLPKSPGRSLMVYLQVSLAPKAGKAAPQGAEGEAAESDEPRIYFGTISERDSSEAGQMRVGPLPGDNTYRIRACAYGANVPYTAVLLQREVHLASGAKQELSLENPEGATMTGKVTNSKDKPLANVNVMVKATDGLVVGALTDDKGRYELRGVPTGTHTLELLRHAERKTPG